MSEFVPHWEHADHADEFGLPRRAWIPAEYGTASRFVTRRLLARAGQGYAVLAEDRWSGGDVVVKGMWWPETALDDPRQVHSVLSSQESRRRQGLHAAHRASQLTQQCPVVISEESQPSPSLVAAGRHPDPPDESFLIQQFIGQRGNASRTLQQDIEERAQHGHFYTEAELLDLAEQLCNTLAALHAERHTGEKSAKGWIHADVKPENILVLGPPARYVLIDYDAAVQIGDRIATTTRAYAPPAPEGSDEPGETTEGNVRFDIYMLGATLAHAAGLRRLTEEQYRQLYAEDFETIGPARNYLNGLGYGPVLTTALATSLSARKFRLATVDRVRIDLARARSATVLLSALRTPGGSAP
ncbi:hypothetical protein ACFYZ8_31890 [Streptomyces sp. NPDC001668]|uniref:hypothetical protein n=1 Tax=unclassified Streptomyces TaxID=2593676 RepID=UPI0036CC1BCB